VPSAQGVHTCDETYWFTRHVVGVHVVGVAAASCFPQTYWPAARAPVVTRLFVTASQTAFEPQAEVPDPSALPHVEPATSMFDCRHTSPANVEPMFAQGVQEVPDQWWLCGQYVNSHVGVSWADTPHRCVAPSAVHSASDPIHLYVPSASAVTPSQIAREVHASVPAAPVIPVTHVSPAGVVPSPFWQVAATPVATA
jgi:hypothetical protein